MPSSGCTRDPIRPTIEALDRKVTETMANEFQEHAQLYLGVGVEG